MKSIILARVSTEEQKEAGNSLPAQIRRGEEYCQRNSYTITKTFSFDESAYKTKRDSFDEILEYIEDSKEKLIVCFDKVDRFSRNIFDKRVSKLNELAMADKIELHFVSDNLVINKDISATEKFQFGINLGLAKYYSDAISDNTCRALQQKLHKGEWIGQARIGYINVTLPDNKRTLELDNNQAFYVKQIFELYATGNYSVKTLLQKMDKKGMRSRSGKKLNPSTIHKILRDKFYIGIMTSKGREYPHKYPTIISHSLFEQVQKKLDNHKKKPIEYASKPFAFRGLIKCKECGCSISPEHKKKPNGKEYTLYSCTNYKKVHKKKVYVNEQELLEPINSLLDDLQMPQKRVKAIVKDLKALNEYKNKYHEKHTKSLQQECNDIQKQSNRLLDLFVDASITREVYDKKQKEYKEKQHQLTVQLEEYAEADESYHIIASTVFSLVNRTKDIFNSSEPNEKRQLINFLVTNCLLSGKNLEFTVRSPFDVIAETAHQPLLLPGSDSNRRPID